MIWTPHFHFGVQIFIHSTTTFFILSSLVQNYKRAKAHYICVITLYCFSWWSFLNLNHVKTTKDFTMFLHIVIKHNPKKRIEKNLIILFLYYDGMEYICMKKYMSQHIQKCKYIPKMIELIFNLHEIYNSYLTFHFT
jgi:hypothetical protein